MKMPNCLLVFVGSALLLGCSGGNNSNPPINNEPLEKVKTEEQMQEEFKKLIPKEICSYQFFSEESQRQHDGETHKTIMELSMIRIGSIENNDFRVSSILKRRSGKTLELVEREHHIEVRTTEGRVSKSDYNLDFKPGRVWHGPNIELLPADNITFAPGSLRVIFYNRTADLTKDFGFDSDVEFFLYEYGCNKESE